jgi:surface protein
MDVIRQARAIRSPKFSWIKYAQTTAIHRVKLLVRMVPAIALLLTGHQAAQAQDAPFITVWKTDNRGASSQDNQIIIYGEGENYTIEWEEVDHPENHGCVTASDDHTITFPHPGTYRVKISGNFTRFYFPYRVASFPPHNEKLLDVEQWGDIAWGSMELAFYSTSNLNVSATDKPDLSNVSNMRRMFSHSTFNGDISGWDVSNVTTLEGIFHGAASFNGDVSNWDVSNVTNLDRAFSVAGSFNGDISGWDVGNVTSMIMTFAAASSFNGDISGWDVSNVTTLEGIFHGAASFNGDVSKWDVSNVTNLSRAFYVAASFIGDVSMWDVSNVTDMNLTFAIADSFNGDVSNWDVGNVTNMNSMFFKAESFDQDLSGWDVGNVTDMSWMFSNASSFNQDLSGWDMSSVTMAQAMLSGSGLSVENYDKTLIGWSEQELTPGLTLGADSLRFCHSTEQRQYIIDHFEWNIFDAGIDDDCKVVSSIEAEDKPQEFELKQNYPNPFNPVTVIPISMAESGQVRLVVYDMLGRRVAVPADRVYDTGRHQVNWDASGLPSGVYVVHMTATPHQGHPRQFSRPVMLIK